MSDDYWRGFIATASFMEPTTIEGMVEWLDVYKTNKGIAPQMLIRLDSGQGVIINVLQARLLEECTRLRPRAGDRIRIVYEGEAKRAAPGMSPTKEFDVTIVQRGQKSQSQERAEGTSGKKEPSDNAPGTGK